MTSIGDRAFYNNQLTSVVIPNSVTSIGDAAFNNNRLPESQAYFYQTPTDSERLVSYGGTNKDIVIQPGTTILSDNAFYAIGITSVVLPDGLTTIGEYTFNSNDLSSIEFPSSVTTSGLHAFSNNPRLQDPTQFFSFTWNSVLNG